MSETKNVGGDPQVDQGSAMQQLTVGANNVRSVFGQGVGRISLIVLGVSAAVMLAYGGMKLFGSKSLPEQERGAAVGVPMTPKSDPMKPVSTDEGTKRAELNNQQAADAAKSGTAYIAPPVVTDKSLDRSAQQPSTGAAAGTSVLGGVSMQPPLPPTVAAVPQPVVGGNGGVVYSAPSAAGQQVAQQGAAPPQVVYQQQPEPPVDPDVKKAVMAQIGAVMLSAKGEQSQQRGFATYYSKPEVNASATARASADGSVACRGVDCGDAAQAAPVSAVRASLTTSSAALNADPIVSTGDTCYATLDNGINSDDTTIVLATIHSCPFEGGEQLRQAKLIGRLERAQEQVRVTFNKLRLANSKRSIPAEAIAVTEDEARSGVGQDVDRHYFSRYFSLGMASILSGYGKAAQQTGGTTVITSGSTTITTEPLTARRQAQIALGEMGTAFAQEIKRDINRPTTISAPRSMGIGVIFISDVMPK